MGYEVLSRHQSKIDCEDDVAVVRRDVRLLAQHCKLDAFATAAVTTATSELTRNVWVHAKRGQATIEEIAEGDRVGLRVQFRDEGPGIADIDRVLAGGYSTVRSMGLGLSGSRRLVDDFALETIVGKGTVITLVKWKLY